MPWKETRVETERRRFVEEYFAVGRRWSMTELCEAFGVSRKTGYKWIDRFRQGGLPELEDRSRARHTQAEATEATIEEALVAARKKHPSWGPRKLLGFLERRNPDVRWPAPSTVGGLLKRRGLVKPSRRRRRGIRPEPTELREATVPNEVWAVDFKGWFRTGDGRRCDPLTISDLHSRFLLECQRVEQPNSACTKPVFEQVFAEYGLPVAIRSDNGAPFASRGAGGLTKLSAWWVKLGIELERITPGCPQQNGCHERMHRTLKRETARPPAANASAQQRRFNRFQHSYNSERPHEALGNDCPADHYDASPRPYPPTVPEMDYPEHIERRQIRTSGEIKWRGQLLYVSQALVGELVGIEEIDDDKWLVRFGPLPLALVDSYDNRILHYRPRGRWHPVAGGHAAVDNSGRPTGSRRSPQPLE
jgi:transposase InsO family protein